MTFPSKNVRGSMSKLISKIISIVSRENGIHIRYQMESINTKQFVWLKVIN